LEYLLSLSINRVLHFGPNVFVDSTNDGEGFGFPL
jgi:hypothetical protein